MLMFLGACAAFGQYHMRHYNSRQVDSSEEDDTNTVLRKLNKLYLNFHKFVKIIYHCNQLQPHKYFKNHSIFKNLKKLITKIF